MAFRLMSIFSGLLDVRLLQVIIASRRMLREDLCVFSSPGGAVLILQTLPCPIFPI